MNTQSIKVAVIAGLVGASLATGVQAFAQRDARQDRDRSEYRGIRRGADELRSLIRNRGEDMAAMRVPVDGDTDRMFAKSMADHHEMGVRMVEIELKYGDDPAVKSLARRIAADGRREIPQLQRLGRTAH